MLGFSALSTRSISGLLSIPAPVVTVTDTHDYPFPVVEEYRKRINRQAKLRREYEDKQRKINNIRAHIEKILHPKNEVIAPVEVVAVPQPIPMVANENATLKNLFAQIELMDKQILLLQQQLQNEYIAYRKFREDRDVEALLYLL